MPRMFGKRAGSSVQMSMVQWIFALEIFSSGGGQEIGVGSDQCERRQRLSLDDRARFESGGELHSIVCAKTVTLSQVDGAVDHRTVDGNQSKMLVTVLKKTAQDAIALIQRDSFGRALLGRQRSGNFGKRDLRKQDCILRLRIGNLPDPRAAGFIGVALYYRASVKEVIAHALAPRWSWMISVREGPLACLRISRVSSRVTAGMILSRRAVLRGRTRPAARRISSAVWARADSQPWSAETRRSRLSVAGSWPVLRACASSRL